MTTIIRHSDSFGAVAKAAAAIASGACVAIPTETVYGLAADATNGEAVAGIFEIKGRPKFNPLICHVSDVAMARRYGRFDEVSERLALRFWPGPLSLVVPLEADCEIHQLVTAGLSTVALRCPLGPARSIIEELGRPLAAPSANRSGRISPTSARHVADEYPHVDLMILDGGVCEVGIESTIVRTGRDHIVILRPGGVTPEELEDVAGLPTISGAQDHIQAPGMLASHYAPRSLVRLDVLDCPSAAALLAFGNGDGRDRRRAAIVLNLSEEGNMREAAANFYNHLKALDSVSAPLIAVEPIPMDGLGVAINDRLTRAAAPRAR